MKFDILSYELILFTMTKIMKINKFFSLFLIVLISFSCGKEFKETEKSTKPNADRVDERSTPSIPSGSFYSKQKLLCDDPLFCPDNVAKIVVTLNNEINYCTGTLIEEDKLLTSASCLPRPLKIPRLSCSENIIAVFPKTVSSDAEIVACDRVEYVDENLFTEPALWQNDLVILKLGKKLNRSLAKISNDGVSLGEKLKGWTVSFKNEFEATLNKVTCNVQLNTFLNPFSVKKHSSMVVMNNCDLGDASSGTSFFRDDEIVTVLSKEMRDRLYSYLRNSDLISGELGRYYHASNVACSNTKITSTSSRISKDCFVTKTTRLLDQKRSRILKGRDIHRSSMDLIKDQVKLPSKYFKWKVEFELSENGRQYDLNLVAPKCINNSSFWIGEYTTRWRRRIYNYAKVQIEVPKYSLITKLSANLTPVSLIEGPEIVNHQIEFNPYDAHVNKKTYVKISTWESGVQTVLQNNDVSGTCF